MISTLISTVLTAIAISLLYKKVGKEIFQANDNTLILSRSFLYISCICFLIFLISFIMTILSGQAETWILVIFLIFISLAIYMIVMYFV